MGVSIFSAAKRMNITDSELNDMNMEFFMSLIDTGIKDSKDGGETRFASKEETAKFFKGK